VRQVLTVIAAIMGRLRVKVALVPFVGAAVTIVVHGVAQLIRPER
jgi:hypothetical protein